MKRRHALAALLAGASVLRMPGAFAQGAATARADAIPFRIYMLPWSASERREQFLEAMSELGWTRNREFVLQESPFGYDLPRLEAAARAAVAENPDLILATSEAYAAAAQGLSKKIPIVMWVSGYPVESGVAASLRRPGSNVTGNTNYAGTGVWGKLLQLLRDAKPEARRIGVLWDYLPPAFEGGNVARVQRELVQDIGPSLGQTVHIVDVAAPAQLDSAIAALSAHAPQALFATAGPVIGPVRARVVRYVMENRLPLISDSPWPHLEPQPLLSYSAPPQLLMRQAAEYVVRILGGGESPAALPIRLPARFELVVDLRTARLIGLSVPPSLLLRADRIVQ
jgi:putative ABC transport system substrate-binding protein